MTNRPISTALVSLPPFGIGQLLERLGAYYVALQETAC